MSAPEDVLEALGTAVTALGRALSCFGAAYELLDETTGDRLEAALFGPAQRGYGVAQRVHAAYAGRAGVPVAPFPPAPEARPSLGVQRLVEDGLEAVDEADSELGDLQEVLLSVEAGDEELRRGLGEVRRAIGDVDRAGRAFVRTLGR